MCVCVLGRICVGAIWPERSQEPPFYPSVLGLATGVAMPNFYVHAADLNSGPGFSEDLAISPVFNQNFFFNERSQGWAGFSHKTEVPRQCFQPCS